MTALVAVRQEWAEGHRRLESERDDRRRYDALLTQAGAVTDELRRRMGSVFTLDELAAEYGRAEVWSRAVFGELRPEDRWAPGLTVAVDAAFYVYARGAKDYEP